MADGPTRDVPDEEIGAFIDCQWERFLREAHARAEAFLEASPLDISYRPAYWCVPPLDPTDLHLGRIVDEVFEHDN